MDRKAILIVLVTVGAMLAWNKLYYSPLAEKDRQAFEAIKKSEAEKKAAEEKAKLAANPASTTPGTTPAQPGTTPATTPGTTPPPAPAVSEPPQLKELKSVPGTVAYEFTSHGGGIIRGTRLGIGRICRCNPWCECGYDPVPPVPPSAHESQKISS